MRASNVRWKTLGGLILGFAAVGAGRAASTEEILGRKIADFALGDYRGKQYSLVEPQPAAATVVAFLGTECPLANVYEIGRAHV